MEEVKMNRTVKNIIVLSAICMASALMLGYLNLYTKPYIEKYESIELEKSINSVSAGMTVDLDIEDGDGKTVVSYYRLLSDNKLSGYLLQLKTAGYGGEIYIAASYDISGKLLECTIVSDAETPGMGKKYESASNIGIFKNYKTIPVTKGSLNHKDAEIVSGASTTFSAIGKALTDGQKFVVSKGGAK